MGLKPRRSTTALLLNSSGSVIASSLRGGSNPERITRQLSAGTYYIRVYCYTGNTNYNLAVSAAPLAPVDLAGNTLATARAITVGSSTTSYTDWVGSTDTNDYLIDNNTIKISCGHSYLSTNC